MKEPKSSDDGLHLTPAPETFFRTVLEDVKNGCNVSTSKATDLYLVSLLAEAAQSPTVISKSEQPFSLRLAQAMNASGGERFERFRQLGDDVLFVSGFFADHLENRGLALDYVASVGQRAYGGAASILRPHAGEPQVFDELAGNFRMFVTLLQHVADSVFAASAKDEMSTLELYERWQRSQSDVLARALLRMGLLPMQGNDEKN